MIGDDGSIAAYDIPTALALIFDYDEDFVKQLENFNIFDVRFHDKLDESSLIENPKINSRERSSAGGPSIVTILSVAAGSVVFVLLLRRIFKGGKEKAETGGDMKDDAGSQDDTVPNTVGEHTA